MSFIQAICPARFHVAFMTYLTVSVTLVLCLTIFKHNPVYCSFVCFKHLYYRDHGRYPRVITGEAQWFFFSFSDSWDGVCPERFLCAFQKQKTKIKTKKKKKTHPCSILLLFVSVPAICMLSDASLFIRDLIFSVSLAIPSATTTTTPSPQPFSLSPVFTSIPS